jgi:prephenate dehydratase
MFFADLDGAVEDEHVAEALAALRGHVETLKILGSYPART